MSETQKSSLSARQYDDEIDLFELLQNLWAQKLIIAFLTLCGLAVAAGYAYIAPVKFTSQVVLAPPSITAFTPFVKDFNIGSGPKVDVLGTALKLSDNVIKLLGRSLLAPNTQAAFISENSTFADCIATSSQGRNSLNKITVSVTCSSREKSLLALDSYIFFASKMALKEFQSLTLAVGVESSIQARDLYSIESPPSTKVTPKKKLILALGIMFGGMIGVFTAIIRIMVTGRKKTV